MYALHFYTESTTASQEPHKALDLGLGRVPCKPLTLEVGGRVCAAVLVETYSLPLLGDSVHSLSSGRMSNREHNETIQSHKREAGLRYEWEMGLLFYIFLLTLLCKDGEASVEVRGQRTGVSFTVWVLWIERRLAASTFTCRAALQTHGSCLTLDHSPEATAGPSIELHQLQTLPSIHGTWVPVVKHNELSSRGFPGLLQNKNHSAIIF